MKGKEEKDSKGVRKGGQADGPSISVTYENDRHSLATDPRDHG